MVFEIGKFYQHASGLKLSIIGELYTTLRRWNDEPTLIAETDCGESRAVGRETCHTVGFHEITKEQWMESFSSQ